jgi:hypothetical protein
VNESSNPLSAGNVGIQPKTPFFGLSGLGESNTAHPKKTSAITRFPERFWISLSRIAAQLQAVRLFCCEEKLLSIGEGMACVIGTLRPSGEVRSALD